MKTLYLVRGVSGSGKSTLAEHLAFNEIAADYWFEGREWTMEAGWILNQNLSYDFDPSNLPDAHFWCQRMTQRWMREGIDEIAVHNTFTTEKELEPYLDMAALFEYRVVSIVVENRHGNSSIHDVPNHVLERQEARLRNSLKLR